MDEFVHDGNGSGRALLKHQGGVREGLLAELAQFVLEVVVLAEPAAQGALTDAGLARGGGDGARGEHGSDGALLAGGESVAADVGGIGATWFAHIVLVLIFRLAGDGGDARRGFAKCMVLKRLKFLDERDWFLGDRGIVTGWGLA